MICKLKDGSNEEVMRSYYCNAEKRGTGHVGGLKIKTTAFNIDKPIEQIVGYELMYRRFEFARFDNVAFGGG